MSKTEEAIHKLELVIIEQKALVEVMRRELERLIDRQREDGRQLAVLDDRSRRSWAVWLAFLGSLLALGVQLVLIFLRR